VKWWSWKKWWALLNHYMSPTAVSNSIQHSKGYVTVQNCEHKKWLINDKKIWEKHIVEIFGGYMCRQEDLPRVLFGRYWRLRHLVVPLDRGTLGTSSHVSLSVVINLFFFPLFLLFSSTMCLSLLSFINISLHFYWFVVSYRKIALIICSGLNLNLRFFLRIYFPADFSTDFSFSD
jgi:hypothetical protein